MTPANLTQLNSVREFQKHFNQAFNLAKASQLDTVYASTQTIAGGLIVCRSFTVNSGVTLTISNPTTIICETFINNGTITMSQATENTLGLFRSSDAPRVPLREALFQSSGIHQTSGTAPGNITSTGSIAGAGGCSYGNGGLGSNNFTSTPTGYDDDGYFAGFKGKSPEGWKSFGIAHWWPIAQFRNPIVGQGSGLQYGKNYFSTSLAWQRKGFNGASYNYTINAFNIFTLNLTTVGGNPGSFLEVFSRVSILNSASGTINAQGAGGGAQAANPNGGGGGGGGVGFYCEGSLSQLGTINCSGGGGGSSGTAGSHGGGGGGGGGIFLTAPTIVNTGTNNVAGGAAGTGVNGNGNPGSLGVVVVEPYLRLWMPGEDDVVVGTRYDVATQ